METTVKLDYTRLELVLFDREKEECIVVYFSVPWEKRFVDQRAAKDCQVCPFG